MKRVFTGRIKDCEIRKKSSSGGAFSAISDIVFSYGNASIYGAAFVDSKNVEHIRAVDIETRNLMRGSKYISSSIANVFSQVAEDLGNDMFVLFTGTPCQIAAINSYLLNKQINTEKLLTMEVICHGVARKDFYLDYLFDLEKKYKSEVISVNFRAKKIIGSKQDMEIVFKNSKKYNAVSTNLDWFYNAYLRNYVLRESCYNCKFSNPNRKADITVADNWQIINEDNSYIILNNEKAFKIIDKLKELMVIEEINEKEIIAPNYYNSSKKPNDYDVFNNIYKNKGYKAAQRYLNNNTLVGKIKVQFAKVIYKLNLKEKIKKLIRKK